MKSLKYAIVLFLVLVTMTFSSDSSIIKLRTLTNLQAKEKLVITFQELGGSCVKCYSIPLALIESVKNRNNLSDFKIVAAVKCNRDIEVNIFKKQNDWKYYLYADKNDLAKKLGINHLSGLAVIDYSGKVLLELEAKKGVSTEDVDKLAAVLRKD